MTRVYKWTIAAGAASLLMGVLSAVPARADDDYYLRDRYYRDARYRDDYRRDDRYYRDNRYHDNLHRDIARDARDIREDREGLRSDEDRLCRLERQRDEYKRCKDWRAVKDTERDIKFLRHQIDEEKRHIRDDEKDLHKDIHRERDWHDRDWR